MKSILSTSAVKGLAAFILIIDIIGLLAAIVLISDIEEGSVQLAVGITSAISFILMLAIVFILILLAEIRDNTKMEEECEEYGNDFSYLQSDDYEDWKKSNPDGTINEYYSTLRNKR
ncbi:MAG: hypothetical protein FWC10_03640 [Lentimicrobiaceae bacterium]|nr:hypothetical protein [Lentimicrobiaceae bacterium]